MPCCRQSGQHHGNSSGTQAVQLEVPEAAVAAQHDHLLPWGATCVAGVAPGNATEGGIDGGDKLTILEQVGRSAGGGVHVSQHAALAHSPLG
jgi:hypothetical protein